MFSRVRGQFYQMSVISEREAVAVTVAEAM